jgi:hypothetical protein
MPDLDYHNEKQGYPLHFAILFHKFLIALRMVRLAKVKKSQE